MAQTFTSPKLITSSFEPFNNFLTELQKENPTNHYELFQKLKSSVVFPSQTVHSAEMCKIRRFIKIVNDVMENFTNSDNRIFFATENDEKIILIVKRYVELLGYYFTYDNKIEITWVTPIEKK